jgi:hypothetical protein
MEYYDNYHPTVENDYDQVKGLHIINDSKNSDRGYNVIYRMKPRADGTLKRSKVEIYTSSGIGNSIRDAETGEYYSHRVGSFDEDLYFKVGLSTGECKSANGSSTLFYLSPRHYMSHLGINNFSLESISLWQSRKDDRLKEISKMQKRGTNMSDIVVN